MKNFKIEIKWAIIFVSMQLTWLLLERVFGFHDTHIDKHVIVTNFIAIPSILIYVLALLDKRKSFYEGKMNYKQGVISGFIITAIVTLLSPAIQWIISTIISPNYFENAIQYAVEQGVQTQEEAEQYFNLGSYISQVLIGTPIMGAVTTLIVAIFTRKS